MVSINGKFNMSNNNADIDARRYLTAANILPGQIYAGDGVNDYPLNSERMIVGVTNLVTSLKATGLYAKIKHIYLILGSTNSYNLVNLIYPNVRDLLTVGTFTSTFGRNGLISDGTSNINTGVYLSEFGEYDISAGVYIRGNGGYTFGTTDKATGTYYWGMSAGSLNAWFKSPSGSLIVGAGGFASGLHVMNMTAINRKTYYLNGNQIALDTSTTTSAVHNSDFRQIWLNQINFSDTYQSGGCNTGAIGVFFLSSGLSDADNVTLYPIINKFTFEIRARDAGNIIYNGFQFFGDSITFGTLGTGYHPWVNHVCYERNASILNYAVGGTTIVDCNNTQIASLIPKDANHTRVFISYSTNDFIHDTSLGGTMTLSTFSSTYATVLGKILAAGYSASDIIVTTGYYVNAAQYTNGDALQDTYLAAANTAAINAGVPSSNIFNYKTRMLANGGGSLISGIHPTNVGHDFIGTDMSAALNLMNF